jgi:hypothetical protein
MSHIWPTAPCNNWSNWQTLGGAEIKDLSVIDNRDGRLEVFVRGDGDGLWHIWQTAPSNGWSNWRYLGGHILGCDAARNEDGRIEVFGVNMSAGVSHIWQTAPNNGWSGWSELRGEHSELTVAANEDGRLEVFARGSETHDQTDNQVWHRWQTKPNGGWSS